MSDTCAVLVLLIAAGGVLLTGCRKGSQSPTPTLTVIHTPGTLKTETPATFPAPQATHTLLPTAIQTPGVPPPQGLMYSLDGELFRVGPGGVSRPPATSTPDFDPIPGAIIHLSSPDGHWAAYLTENSLHLVNIKTQAAQELVQFSSRNLSLPAWSSDSRVLYFFSDYESVGEVGATELYAYDLASGETRRLTFTQDRSECCVMLWPGQPDLLLMGSWEPDEDVAGSLGHLTLVQAAAASYEVLGPELSIFEPAFDPTQTRIIYLSGRDWYSYQPGGSPERFDPERYLPENQRVGVSGFIQPVYAPDGRLAFQAVVDEQGVSRSGVAVIDPSATSGWVFAPYVHTGMGGSPGEPHWTADGEWLAFIAAAASPDESGLWYVSADGQERYFFPGDAGQVVFSRDFGWAVYTGTGETVGQVLMASAGLAQPQVLELPVGARPLDWESP